MLFVAKQGETGLSGARRAQGWGELRSMYMGDNGTIVIGYHDIRAAMMAHHTLRKENMDIRYATARDGIGAREATDGAAPARCATNPSQGSWVGPAR